MVGLGEEMQMRARKVTFINHSKWLKKFFKKIILFFFHSTAQPNPQNIRFFTFSHLLFFLFISHPLPVSFSLVLIAKSHKLSIFIMSHTPLNFSTTPSFYVHPSCLPPGPFQLYRNGSKQSWDPPNGNYLFICFIEINVYFFYIEIVRFEFTIWKSNMFILLVKILI